MHDDPPTLERERDGRTAVFLGSAAVRALGSIFLMRFDTTPRLALRALLLANALSVASCSSDDDAQTDDHQRSVDAAGLGSVPDRAGPLSTEDASVATLDAASKTDAADRASVDATTDGAAFDAQSTVDSSPGEAAACVITNARARCQSRTIEEIGAANDLRKVYWARPTQAAPNAGYPAVILYQGSYFGPSGTWNTDVAAGTAFGGYHQVRVVAELLAKGFVVIQPAAQNEVFWSTNVTADFASSTDGVFIPVLLSKLAEGTFGQLDLTKLYATGMSSGGYMTSRMAVSFAGKFRALAIHSAAYATCGGPLCNVPASLPADHPPTLFLHGTADTIVPISTAKSYESKLRAAGIATSFVEEAGAGHEWLSAAPSKIADWFLAH